MAETANKHSKAGEGAQREAARRAPAASTLGGLEYGVEFANPPQSNYAIGHAIGGGIALPDDLRQQFEGRFGADFSDVRLHNGPAASAHADLLDANAFTTGSDIFFSQHRYAPFTSSGKHLIAHELAHVIQQRRGGAAPDFAVGAPHERAADAAAQAYATQSAAIAVEGSTGVGIACDQKQRPTTAKFLAEAFHANRFHAWSNKISGWPVDPQLRQLWSTLNVASSYEQSKKGGFAEADTVIKRPEFVQFVELVREFQYQNFPNVDKSFDGIVDSKTAAKLNERNQRRADERELRDVQRRHREVEAQKAAAHRRVIEKVSVGSAAKPASQAKPTSWTDRVRSTGSGALSTLKNAADDPRGTYNAVADKAEATLDSAVGTVKKAAADPGGTFDAAVDKAQDYISSITVGQVKDIFIDLLFAQLGPRLGGSGMARKLLTAIAEGMGEQLYQEVIREKKGEKLIEHLKKITKNDLGELYKGYVIGALEGLVSPVTDLYGLLVFGETMHNMMQDAMLKAIANIGNAGPEAKALLASVGTFATSLGEFMAKVRENPSEVILAVLKASDVLEAKAIEKAKQLGREGGSAIVASFEEPWKPKQEVAAPDPLKSPLAYVQHQAKAGEDYLLDTPWAKVGSKAGYAVGFVVIQVLLLVFTSGIGNAITKASGALAKVAGALNGLGSRAAKAVGAATARVAKLVEALGSCITSIGTVVDTVLAKVIEKLPSIGKALKPIGDVMEKLKKFLQKLLGVAENKTAAVIDAVGAKTAGALGDDAPKALPKPPPPPEVKPPPSKPSASSASGAADQGSNVRPIVSEKKPPTSPASKKLDENLAKQPPGKVGSVTPINKAAGKPDPLPPVKSQKIPAQQVQEDAGKIAVGQTHGAGGGGTASQAPGGKAPPVSAVKQGDTPLVAGPGKKSAPTKTQTPSTTGKGKPSTTGKAEPPSKSKPPVKGPDDDPLVVVKIRGKNKGQYWQDGTPQFQSNAGSAKSGPNRDYVVLPKSEANRLKFRPAGTPPKTDVKPRVIGGRQAESTGAGRQVAGREPGSKSPPHPISARTTRQPPPKGKRKSPDLEMDEADPAAAHAFPRTIGADVAQAQGYNRLLDNGEYGILRPGNISTGGVDAITAEVKGGKAKIFLNDFTTPGAAKVPKKTHLQWRRELDAAVEGKRINDAGDKVNRLDFGDKKINDAIRKAIDEGEVYVRTVRVELPNVPTAGPRPGAGTLEADVVLGKPTKVPQPKKRSP